MLRLTCLRLDGHATTAVTMTIMTHISKFQEKGLYCGLKTLTLMQNDCLLRVLIMK